VAPLVLLQSSDWHVGSPLSGRGLGLTEEFRSKRREEVDAGFETQAVGLDAAVELERVGGRWRK